MALSRRASIRAWTTRRIRCADLLGGACTSSKSVDSEHGSRVSQCAGKLANYKKSYLGLIRDMTDFGRYQEPYILLLQVLQQKVGLSLQEAMSYLQGYSEDSFSQWRNDLGEIQERSIQSMNESHHTASDAPGTH